MWALKSYHFCKGKDQYVLRHQMQNNNDFSCVCECVCTLLFQRTCVGKPAKARSAESSVLLENISYLLLYFLHIFPFSPTLDQPIPLSLCASSRCCLLPPLAWGGCKQHFSSRAHASMCLASRFGEKLHQEIIACMEGSLSRRTPHKALNQPHRRHQTLFMGCKLTFFPQLFRSLHTFDAKSFRSFT